MKSEGEIREFYESVLKADLEIADRPRRKRMPIIYSIHACEIALGLFVLLRVELLQFGSWPADIGNLWSPYPNIGFLGVTGACILHAFLCRAILRRDRASWLRVGLVAILLIPPCMASLVFFTAVAGPSMMGLFILPITLKQSPVGWGMLAGTAGLLSLGIVSGVAQFLPLGPYPGEQWLPVAITIIIAGLVRGVIVVILMDKPGEEFKETIINKITKCINMI